MTQDNPKTWGEMTPEEKGALLLAHHEQMQLELYSTLDKVWQAVRSPSWSGHSAYRVKPEPKRKTVRLFGYGTFANVLREDYWTEDEPGVAKYAITFDTLDGKPVLNSIRMEALT